MLVEIRSRVVKGLTERPRNCVVEQHRQLVTVFYLLLLREDLSFRFRVTDRCHLTDIGLSSSYTSSDRYVGKDSTTRSSECLIRENLPLFLVSLPS